MHPDESGQSAFELTKANQLGRGIKASDLLDAVKRSGYPFQAEVASELRAVLSKSGRHLSMQEEWAYIDSETNQTRSLDIWARMPLPGRQRDPIEQRMASRLWPHLDLLIECKQSELPYVFFLRSELSGETLNFPEVVGLPSNRLRLFRASEDGVPDGQPSYYMSLHNALHTENLDFCGPSAPFAISFAKALRKGSKLELTGEETYRAITMPLTKAADYLKSRYSYRSGDKNTRMGFVVCIAVIRAPMFGVYLHKGEQILLETPWVRTCQMEPSHAGSNATSTGGTNVRYFDVVHFDYFKQYVSAAIRDIETLARRALDSHEVVASGIGLSVSGTGPNRTSLDLLPFPSGYEHLKERKSSLQMSINATQVDYGIPDLDQLNSGDVMRLIPKALRAPLED